MRLRHITYIFIFILASLWLTSCGTLNESVQSVDSGPLTPLPGEYSQVKDPNNTLFQRAISQYLRSIEAPPSTRYEYTRIDLNNDTRRDAIILLKTPHHYWCTTDGCPLIIMKAHNDSFELVSVSKPVRSPFIVSAKETHGWKDIIARVSGRTRWEPKDVALTFDGTRYPRNPENLEPLPLDCNPRTDGTIIFP